MPVLVGCLAVSCVGCAGLITPSGPSKRDTQAMIERNLKNLRRLQVGMFEEYVADVMGKPQRVEIYAWGTSWLYRTAMADGAGGVAESDLTPLVFDDRGVLLGWGQSFLAQQMKRHE